MSLVVFSLQFILNIALPWWIVRFSERRLTLAEQRHAWNEASFRSAVVVFGPLCLPVHFARVGAGKPGWRRGLRVALGLLLGICVMLLELLLVGLSLSLVAWLGGGGGS